MAAAVIVVVVVVTVAVAAVAELRPPPPGQQVVGSQRRGIDDLAVLGGEEGPGAGVGVPVFLRVRPLVAEQVGLVVRRVPVRVVQREAVLGGHEHHVLAGVGVDEQLRPLDGEVVLHRGPDVGLVEEVPPHPRDVRPHRLESVVEGRPHRTVLLGGPPERLEFVLEGARGRRGPRSHRERAGQTGAERLERGSPGESIRHRLRTPHTIPPLSVGRTYPFRYH